MATHYDAAIIGTGQAGPALANRLTRAGMKWRWWSAGASAAPL
jgi:cation diffusion facilitator CzcD-associated flavoprotein CzcO